MSLTMPFALHVRDKSGDTTSCVLRRHSEKCVTVTVKYARIQTSHTFQLARDRAILDHLATFMHCVLSDPDRYPPFVEVIVPGLPPTVVALQTNRRLVYCMYECWNSYMPCD